MLRLRFHGRGGQGAKVASRVLGTAAFLEGCYAQDFPLYGAERRGAPIAAFTRIGKAPIMERGVITEPDVVIVMDETLMRDPRAKPVSGLKKGGVVFINTPCSPEEAQSTYELSAQVITLDLTKIGLEILGRPILSTLAGAVAARIVGLKEASVLTAVEQEISKIVTDSALVEKNKEAARRSFNALAPAEIKTRKSVRKGSAVMTMPYEPALVSSPTINAIGNTPLRKTGNWRCFKPVWDLDLCTKCTICAQKCPEGCISIDEEGYPVVDYDNCKGCLICVEECPRGGITAVRENHTASLSTQVKKQEQEEEEVEQ
jgi:pyruvate ferredoxin oxidoreductase gamma subunit